MCNITRTNTMSRLTRAFSAIMLFGLFSFNAMAGQTGEIRGTVKNDKGDLLQFAVVRVMAGSHFISGTTTDFDGNYSVTNLEAGKYDVEFSFNSHNTLRMTGVAVGANKTAYVNPILTSTQLKEVVIETKKAEKPMIDKEFSTIKTLDLDQIERMAVATGDINGMIVNVSTDVQPTNDGKGLYMRGSRSNATGMIIDGVRIINGGDIPSTSIGGILVLSGGVPAEYGDFTGGLIVITTKSYTQGIREKRVRNFEAKEKMEEKKAEEAQKKLEREQKKLEQEQK